MAQIGELMVKIGVDASSVTRGLEETGKQMKNMAANLESSLGPAMDKIGQALKVVGTAALAGFGAAAVGAVKGASELENYRNTLNVVMKDQEQAGKTMAWAVDFANKTPFETDSIVEATVRLTSYGLKAQEVMPAIGDMAGVMNKDIMQAVEAVADAQTGELERLKEFGITKAMIVEQGAKTMRGVELVNNQGQIVDQENFNKALFSLMNDRFKGGMDLQANSFSGIMSTIKGTFSTTLATMAGISATGEVKIGGFFDTLKNKMQLVISKINEWQQNGQLQAWADQAGAALSTFFGTAEKVFGYIIDVAKDIYKYWDLIGPVLAGVLGSFLAFSIVEGVLKAITIAQTALNFAMSLNPIGLIIIGIGLLVAAGVALYMNWDTVQTKARELWNSIGAIWDNIKTKTEDTWNGIKTFINTTWDNLITWGTTKWTNFKNMFLGVWGAIGIGLKGYVNGIISMVNSVINALNTIQVTIPDWVPSYGGQSFGVDIPNVPMLAKGGIVTRPTLTMIGEAGPEAVVPLKGYDFSFTPSGMVGNARNSITNNFDIKIQGANAREIWEELNPIIIRSLAIAGVN